MHHIDRTVDEMEFSHEQDGEFGNEYESEYQGEDEYEEEYEDENEDEYESEDEYSNEYENEYEEENENESEDEMMEMELATELLSVNNEEEMEQFLGKLGKLKRAAGKFMKSPAGAMLKKYLKGVAKKVLPVAGTALGGMVGGPIGAKLASSATQATGKALGLEMEGLSQEDQEYEVARGYVRFAKDAIRRGSSNSRYRHSPRSVAKSSMINAAKRHAPGFLSPKYAHHLRRGRRPALGNQNAENGTWTRNEDGSVILYGL